MAKSADDAGVPPICAAIAQAVALSGESLAAIAVRAKVPYQSLQKWADGREPKLSNVAKLERALRPNAPAGWLLVAAGVVECPTTTEVAIRGDGRLSEAGGATASDRSASLASPAPTSRPSCSTSRTAASPPPPSTTPTRASAPPGRGG